MLEVWNKWESSNRNSSIHLVIYLVDRWLQGQWVWPTLPGGSHRVVAFMLADMAMGVEASRLKSDWEIDNGKQNTYMASIAKAMASEVYNKSAADAVQVRRERGGSFLQ